METYICASCAWSGTSPATHEHHYHGGAQTCWTDAEWRAGERTAASLA